MQQSDNIQLVLDTINQREAVGIPTVGSNIMEHSIIERLAGVNPGEYRKDPYRVYHRMQLAIGSCMKDQYIPENPLTMGDHGYEHKGTTATTGAQIMLDDIKIDSPEAAVDHMERYAYQRLENRVTAFCESETMQQIICKESHVQSLLGPTILKTGYGAPFPTFLYGTYGYENYFMAYALYPEVIEHIFKLQADYAEKYNAAMVKAFKFADRPLYCRLDHDMADGSGTLVSLQSLERLWLPHFARSIRPLVDAGFKLLWHSDGNLMGLYPYLFACGVNGFQGFQYECGVDYRKICRMKTRDGREPVVIAGVSVTRTLPFGKPDDVKRELRFLVENGPKTGLFLGTSSSCTPGVPWENIKTYVEGVRYFRQYGRKGL